MMKITVFVSPKKNVLDPQGAAVKHAMYSLGFSNVEEVRVGKTIEFEIKTKDTAQFRIKLDKLCTDLLSNPVIESYRYEIHPSN
jgi:phosphoribosylformylglycinamidine synthase subunit PurS